MPSILATLKNSGAIDVTLEEDEEGNESTEKGQNYNCKEALYSDTRRHYGTQTELWSL